jgi:hypothetical protein
MSDGQTNDEPDFYLEGPYVVFTESFLRKRGYCCESGCRHCPWGFRPDRRSDVPDEDPPE